MEQRESLKSAASTVIEEDFDEKPFAVGPEALGRLTEIINRRLSDESTQAEFTFEVTRMDGWQFRTNDLDSLLNDGRLQDDALKKFSISSRRGQFRVDLDFDSKAIIYPIRLGISGPDHDAVHSLASELRKYMRSSVIVREPPRWLASWVVCFAGFAGVRSAIRFLPETPAGSRALDPKTVLESPDANIKLNYLIQEHIKNTYPFSDWMPIFAIALVAIFGVIYFFTAENPIIIGYLFPTNVFLFGSEKKRYDSGMALRGKLLWAVVVALLISILAGAIVHFTWR